MVYQSLKSRSGKDLLGDVDDTAAYRQLVANPVDISISLGSQGR